MDHAATNITGLSRAERRASRRVVLNWRLVLALGVNVAMWGGIVLGIRAMLD